MKATTTHMSGVCLDITQTTRGHVATMHSCIHSGLAVYPPPACVAGAIPPTAHRTAHMEAAQRFSLVLGVLSATSKQRMRSRLRSEYRSLSRTDTILVRFVLDGSHTSQADEVGTPDVPRARETCSVKKRVALMSFHWWRVASQWDSAFYGQTEDDAVLDLEQLSVFVHAISPSSSSLDDSSSYHPP